MKRENYWKVLSVFLILVAVLMVVNTALGQGPDPNGQSRPPITLEPNEFPDEVDPGSEGQADAAEDIVVLAQPPSTLNYQGFLTDGSNTPLDGTFNLTFSFYDAAAGGTEEWGPETHGGVPVTNGLFSVALGQSVTLLPDVFNKELFLQVSVNGVALTTRQPVRPVAYAFGLVPGAEVDGDPANSFYGLTVNNTGVAPNDRGLYAKGQEYGLYAEEVGIGDVGIYSPDFVQAQGYKSNDDSYIWVPGTEGVTISSASPVNIGIWYTGRVALTSPATGIRYFFIPVSLPSQLYGQEVRVEQLTVYYYTTNSASYIDSTTMYRLNSASLNEDILISDGTNRNSTVPTASYSLNASGNNILSNASGPLQVRLQLNFASTGHTIYIGAIRVRLGHTD